jgi:hypothetical protein
LSILFPPPPPFFNNNLGWKIEKLAELDKGGNTRVLQTTDPKGKIERYLGRGKGIGERKRVKVSSQSLMGKRKLRK